MRPRGEKAFNQINLGNKYANKHRVTQALAFTQLGNKALLYNTLLTYLYYFDLIHNLNLLDVFKINPLFVSRN